MSDIDAIRKYLETIGSNQKKSTLTESILTEDRDTAYELREIQEQMLVLLDEAYDLVPSDEKARAKAYWYGHIASALGSEMYPSNGDDLGSLISDLEQRPDDENYSGDEEWDAGTLDY